MDKNAILSTLMCIWLLIAFVEVIILIKFEKRSKRHLHELIIDNNENEYLEEIIKNRKTYLHRLKLINIVILIISILLSLITGVFLLS